MHTLAPNYASELCVSSLLGDRGTGGVGEGKIAGSAENSPNRVRLARHRRSSLEQLVKHNSSCCISGRLLRRWCSCILYNMCLPLPFRYQLFLSCHLPIPITLYSMSSSADATACTACLVTVDVHSLLYQACYGMRYTVQVQ